jgi:hypothetical protein
LDKEVVVEDWQFTRRVLPYLFEKRSDWGTDTINDRSNSLAFGQSTKGNGRKNQERGFLVWSAVLSTLVFSNVLAYDSTELVNHTAYMFPVCSILYDQPAHPDDKWSVRTSPVVFNTGRGSRISISEVHQG